MPIYGPPGSITASTDARWKANTNYPQLGQLVVNGSNIYEVSTAHVSTNSFDSSKFTLLGAASSGPTPNIIAAAGTTRTLAQGTSQTTIDQVTLDQASCAFTFTGFTNVDGVSRTKEVHIIGHAGRTITFTDTFNSMSAGYLPLAVTAGITIIQVWTDGDGFMNIDHGQRVRPWFWKPFKGNLAVFADPAPFKLGAYDARIVAIDWEVGTAPTSASIIGDYLKNGTSLYTGATGNRPTIAAGNTTTGAVTLPASPLLAPNDLLTASLLQVGSAVTGADLLARMDLLVAV